MTTPCNECARKEGVIAQLIAECERLEEDRDAAVRAIRVMRREKEAKEAP